MEDGGVVEFEAVGEGGGIRRVLAEDEEGAGLPAEAAEVAGAAPAEGEPGGGGGVEAGGVVVVEEGEGGGGEEGIFGIGGAFDEGGAAGVGEEG